MKKYYLLVGFLLIVNVICHSQMTLLKTNLVPTISAWEVTVEKQIAFSNDCKFLYLSHNYSDSIYCYSTNFNSGDISLTSKLKIDQSNKLSFWSFYTPKIENYICVACSCYVDSSAIVTFDRNLSSGQLTYKTSVKHSDYIANKFYYGGASNLIGSYDDKTIYANGTYWDGTRVYNNNNGQLKYIQRIDTVLSNINICKNYNYLYSVFDGKLHLFSRNTDGTINYKKSIADNVDRLFLKPDDSYLFGLNSTNLFTFKINSSDGLISKTNIYNISDLFGNQKITGLTFVNNGDTLLINSDTDIFSAAFNLSTGNITNVRKIYSTTNINYLKLLNDCKNIALLTNNNQLSLFSINLSSTTSLSEISDKNSIVKVYPSPASHKITIESLSLVKKIEITDLNGKIVIGELVNANIKSINVETLNSGFYLLRIISKDGIETHKIEIKK